MVSFDKVSKFILSDVTFHVPKGTAVGIIGASGAGKTTLLRLVCGLLAAEQGNVYTLQKNPVEHRAELGKRMGCLLERMPLLNAELSLADNFKERKIIHRMSELQFLEDYVPLAERFGIQNCGQEQVKALSFGQQRRAELVAALLHRPELLLLDEPTNALDENAKNILKEVLEERKKEGMTVLLTSHDWKTVSGLCDRILVLEKGNLLYYGEEAALLRRYAPMDVMKVRISGGVPDLEDLPVTRYEVQGEELILTYNSNEVTASTILEVLLKQVGIKEVNIEKQNLADVIFNIKRREQRVFPEGEEA